MFKRKYVDLSSEKVIKKIEDFLEEECWSETLHPIELYALRYAFKGIQININNQFSITRIGLNDILPTFNSSEFIIFSENDNYGVKSDDDILKVYSNLDKRMIFFIFSDNKKYIEEICIYLPSYEDTTLVINGIYHLSNDICVADSEEDFIKDLSNHNKDLIKYYLQDDAIIQFDDLKFEKEFFVFTNLNIEKSTIIFHYIP